MDPTDTPDPEPTDEPDVAPPKRDTQAEQFAHELWRVISRFRDEYDMSAAQMIGTIEIVKLELYTEI